MKKPTKTKAVKAVKFWKSAGGSYLYPDKKAAQYFSGFQAPSVKPVAVLPVDAESVADMISQIAIALCNATRTEGVTMNGAACLALASIGIKGGAK